MSDVNDELDGSPILEEVLGDALGKLKVFHVKLAAEGEPRGLIGPRDVGIIWERHILNSAAIVPYVRNVTNGIRFKTVADVGSGGGFADPAFSRSNYHDFTHRNAGPPVHFGGTDGTPYRMAS